MIVRQPSLRARHCFLLVALLCLAWAITSRAETRPDSAGYESVFSQGAREASPTRPEARIDTLEIRKNFGRAALEIFGLNASIWFYDRYIRSGGGAGFRIGFGSWAENIENGFEWDDNNFNTNQFAHPYHGSLYFNAARSNGYSFWESAPFAFGGSFMWEYFAETHHPSINDWFATSLGGMALGESLYRLSSIVLDNTATGSERTWREIGALALNPVRGFNRILTGEAFQVHANPKDRYPSKFATVMDAGLRTVSEDRLWESDTTNAYFEFDFGYGNPYEGRFTKPFDHFNVGVQVNFSDISTLGRVQARGRLYGGTVHESPRSKQVLAAYQFFDYIQNRAFEFGGQSFGPSFNSLFRSASGVNLRTELDLNGYLLAAVKSDYKNFSGREYDYGPGLGFRFRAFFERSGWTWVLASHAEAWVHAVNGNAVDHYISVSRIRFAVPIRDYLGAGADYLLYLKNSEYEDFPDVDSRNPVFRLFLSWQWGA